MNIDHSGDSSEWGLQIILYFCVITHGWSLGHLIHSLITNCDILAIFKLAAIIAGCTCCYHFHLSEYSSAMKLVCCLVSGVLGLILRGGLNDLEVEGFDILAFTVQIISVLMKVMQI